MRASFLSPAILRLATRIESLEHSAQSRQPWSGDARGLSLPQWFEKQTVQFERLAALEIDQRGRAVGAQFQSAVNVRLREGGIDGEPLGVGGGNNFQHHLAHEIGPAWVGEQLVGGHHPLNSRHRQLRVKHGLNACRGGDAESVERDVPDKLFPVGALEVIGHRARHAGVAERGGDVLRARPGLALEFTDENVPVRRVPDDAGFGAVEAHVAQAAKDLLRGEKPGERLFVAEAVLQGEHHGVRTDHGREQFGKLIVGGGFQADHNEIRGPDLLRRARAMRSQLKIAVGTQDLNAVFAHEIVI